MAVIMVFVDVFFCSHSGDTLKMEAAGFSVFQTIWHHIPEGHSHSAQLLMYECCVSNLMCRYCALIIDQDAI